MIVALVLLTSSDDFTASRFFPLVPGNHWVYEDSDAPGSVFESTVKPEVKPPPEQIGDKTIETPPAYFPLEQREDGRLTQVLCYHETETTLFHVGNGPDKPVSPRPVLVVSRRPIDWEFYGDNVSVYAPEPVHYTAHSAMGPTATVLGKPHATVIVTMLETFGPKKVGVEIKQVWHYAADIGMYEVDEDGTVGPKPVHHVRKLIKFEPGRAG